MSDVPFSRSAKPAETINIVPPNVVEPARGVDLGENLAKTAEAPKAVSLGGEGAKATIVEPPSGEPTPRVIPGGAVLNVASKAVFVAGVFLTFLDAAKASGIIGEGEQNLVERDVLYYFADGSGSVFTIGSQKYHYVGFTHYYRNFKAGPKKGQREEIDSKTYTKYIDEAEAKYGKYYPPTHIFGPIFIPGTDRKRLPYTDVDSGREGWIDKEGVHYKWRHGDPV